MIDCYEWLTKLQNAKDCLNIETVGYYMNPKSKEGIKWKNLLKQRVSFKPVTKPVTNPVIKLLTTWSFLDG